MIFLQHRLPQRTTAADSTCKISIPDDENGKKEEATFSFWNVISTIEARWTNRIIPLLFLCTAIALTVIFGVRMYRRAVNLHYDYDLYDYEMGGGIQINEHREHEAHGVLLPVEQANLAGMHKDRFAYVSLLCDNSALPQARVLAFALHRAKASYPLIFMVLPSATEGLEELISLGATIERVPPVPTPFVRPSGKRRPADGKLCKYSKIHAWSLTQYTKLVYLDLSLLIVSVWKSLQITLTI
jgi:hypothetical protein